VQRSNSSCAKSEHRRFVIDDNGLVRVKGDDAYCAHDVPMSDECSDCEEEAEDAERSSS